MEKMRRNTLMSVLKGLFLAIAVTLVSIAVIAAIVLLCPLSDGGLRVLNQLAKLLAILAGTVAAVGRGGHRGFITGMALAAIYMILGYVLCLILGGTDFDTADMLGEILLGAALGGIAGAVLSNLPPRRRSRSGRHTADKRG